jgi:hypothetical protein
MPRHTLRLQSAGTEHYIHQLVLLSVPLGKYNVRNDFYWDLSKENFTQ